MPKYASLRLISALASAALAFGISVAPLPTPAVAQLAPAQQRNQSIDDLFRDFTAEWVRNDPNLARATRYFTGEEQDRLERQLTPGWTVAWREGRVQLARRGLAELRSFDRASMNDVQRVSADLMEWGLQTWVDSEPFFDDGFPLQQFGGANVNLVNVLTIAHPIVTERDAENYVAALGQVGARMREAIDEARRRAGKGILPPNFILRATIDQMQRFIATPAAQNPFVATLTQKMPTAVPEAKRQQLLSQAEQIVQQDVYPAWREGIGLLESQVPAATDDAGLWRLPNGAAAYANSLRLYTTTKMTADEIHELGLRQVDAIQAQMDQILRRLGRTEGSVKDRIEKLRQERAYPNPTSEESRAQIMRDIESIMADAQRRAALLFDLIPKSPVVAQPYQQFQEANAQASYSAPTADGSRPGTFQFPRRVEKMTKFDLRTLVHHETVPGHHFQIALQLENKDLPLFRQRMVMRGGAAHVEGWGLYAEHLAAESGWYDNDLEGLLGQLFWEEFRARRLVVDTGLHAKHWTRQQAIDYGIESAEVDRYVVTPGQATAYMVGELKILELRERVRQALGDKFSIREFHNVVLSTARSRWKFWTVKSTPISPAQPAVSEPPRREPVDPLLIPSWRRTRSSSSAAASAGSPPRSPCSSAGSMSRSTSSRTTSRKSARGSRSDRTAHASFMRSASNRRSPRSGFCLSLANCAIGARARPGTGSSSARRRHGGSARHILCFTVAISMRHSRVRSDR
jgi:uncharacterized protein (DUF885 family)